MKNQKGFSLIELLVVVIIIVIIAAIAIPNLLNAIQRGKQKRTMGDMRTVGTANETYSLDANQYINIANTTVNWRAGNSTVVGVVDKLGSPGVGVFTALANGRDTIYASASALAR